VGKELPTEANRIFLFSLDTRRQKALTAPPALSRGDSFPVFSQDGTQLAFIRDLEGKGVVHVVASSGGEPRPIGQNGYSGLAWISDDRLVLPSPPRGGGSPLWSLSTKDGSSAPLGIGGENTLYPAISRRNGLLAFTKWTFNTNVWRVEIPSSSDGAPEEIRAGRPAMLISSTGRQDSPRFSPDGRHIVFASDRSGSSEIWKCDRDGNNAVKLTSIGGPLAGSPSWSPDSEWIIFDSRGEGNADIYVVSAQGGPLRAITTNESEDIVPSWSRDGQWIYFSSDRAGDQQIWKVPAKGGQPLQVTRGGGFEAFESFEGDVIYYSKRDRQLGLWRIRPDGSDERPAPGLSEAGFGATGLSRATASISYPALFEPKRQVGPIQFTSSALVVARPERWRRFRRGSSGVPPGWPFHRTADRFSSLRSTKTTGISCSWKNSARACRFLRYPNPPSRARDCRRSHYGITPPAAPRVRV